MGKKLGMGLQHSFNEYWMNDWVCGNMLGVGDKAVKERKTGQLTLTECLCVLHHAIEDTITILIVDKKTHPQKGFITGTQSHPNKWQSQDLNPAETVVVPVLEFQLVKYFCQMETDEKTPKTLITADKINFLLQTGLLPDQLSVHAYSFFPFFGFQPLSPGVWNLGGSEFGLLSTTHVNASQ